MKIYVYSDYEIDDFSTEQSWRGELEVEVTPEEYNRMVKAEIEKLWLNDKISDLYKEARKKKVLDDCIANGIKPNPFFPIKA